MTELDTSILIVGGGPVGLVMAIDLAMRGVDVTIVETRYANEPPSVKCNHVAARTMETFRRLGFADRVRAAGLPDDYPNDIVFRTETTGRELSRIPIPGRATRFSDRTGPDGWWPTPEPPHRINQIYLEPILFDEAAHRSGVTILNRTRVDSFTQDDTGVVAAATDLETGQSLRINARYIVGCDGGRSMTRRTIGAELRGDAVIQRVQSTYFRAPSLLGRLTTTPSWMSYSYRPERAGNVVAIDGKELWLLHNYLLPGETDFESVDRDASLRLLLGVGPDFEYEILAKEDWFGRRLVADRLRDRRAFICGDAAHLWVPYAGYGMNAGIADGVDLAWQLAAHIQGWAPAGILDAYERERWPITDQVSRFAMNHAQDAIKERTSVPPEVLDDTPEGERARRELGQAAYDLNVQQFACAGLNFGYYYDQSPIIAYDGAQAPAYSMGSFTASTVPGCRAPFFTLADGSGLYDRLGPWYTLLRFDAEVDVGSLLAAAADAGVPLALLDLAGEQVPPEYADTLALVRPDQHIAWRGDDVPADARALIDLIRGARNAAAPIGRAGDDASAEVEDDIVSDDALTVDGVIYAGNVALVTER